MCAYRVELQPKLEGVAYWGAAQADCSVCDVGARLHRSKTSAIVRRRPKGIWRNELPKLLPAREL
jgi:hypothetical protein